MRTRDSQTLQVTEQGKVIALQERPLGQVQLHTYRKRVDIGDILPNEKQPRLQPGEYEELQRQIEANDGLFEPILVEPHPDVAGMFRIIDGHRRWASCRALVAQGKNQYRQIPVEVTDRTLSDEERLRVWIYTHHQRKEWGVGERELVARRLLDFVGQANAANILGITVPELEQLVETSKLWPRSPALLPTLAIIRTRKRCHGRPKAPKNLASNQQYNSLICLPVRSQVLRQDTLDLE